jgi:hypothetical protein
MAAALAIPGPGSFEKLVVRWSSLKASISMLSASVYGAWTTPCSRCPDNALMSLK